MEAPALARLQEQYEHEGFKVVAINFEPAYSLNQWVAFWKQIGAGDVLWAQDSQRVTPRAYDLVTLGTEIVVDRRGIVTFRSDGPAGYDQLRSAVEQAL